MKKILFSLVFIFTLGLLYPGVAFAQLKKTDSLGTAEDLLKRKTKIFIQANVSSYRDKIFPDADLENLDRNLTEAKEENESHQNPSVLENYEEIYSKQRVDLPSRGNVAHYKLKLPKDKKYSLIDLNCNQNINKESSVWFWTISSNVYLHKFNFQIFKNQDEHYLLITVANFTKSGPEDPYAYVAFKIEEFQVTFEGMAYLSDGYKGFKNKVILKEKKE